MRLYIGNLDPQVSDAELCSFLLKYTTLEPVSISRVEGDGSRPGAMLDFPGIDPGELMTMQTRLHGMYWNGRALFVETLMR